MRNCKPPISEERYALCIGGFKRRKYHFYFGLCSKNGSSDQFSSRTGPEPILTVTISPIATVALCVAVSLYCFVSRTVARINPINMEEEIGSEESDTIERLTAKTSPFLCIGNLLSFSLVAIGVSRRRQSEK